MKRIFFAVIATVLLTLGLAVPAQAWSTPRYTTGTCHDPVYGMWGYAKTYIVIPGSGEEVDGYSKADLKLPQSGWPDQHVQLHYAEMWTYSRGWETMRNSHPAYEYVYPYHSHGIYVRFHWSRYTLGVRIPGTDYTCKVYIPANR